MAMRWWGDMLRLRWRWRRDGRPLWGCMMVAFRRAQCWRWLLLVVICGTGTVVLIRAFLSRWRRTMVGMARGSAVALSVIVVAVVLTAR